MKRALVVDDSSVIRKIARRILEEMKFDVAEAPDGSDALVMCTQSMPDIILLDWHMPEMDGIEFVKRLRQMEQGGYPKVIFCTTENQLPKIINAMEAGADEYIMKPFNEMIIREKLMQVGMISS